jgi:hypothetical protein
VLWWPTMIDRVAVRTPAGENQSHHEADSDVVRRMLDDCGAPIGKGLSSLWLCAGPEEMTKVIRVSRQGTDYTAGIKRKQKAQVCGGRRGPSSPRGFPSFLCAGRPAGEAMLPTCDEGLGPLPGRPPAAPRGRKAKATSENRLFIR